MVGSLFVNLFVSKMVIRFAKWLFFSAFYLCLIQFESHRKAECLRSMDLPQAYLYTGTFKLPKTRGYERARILEFDPLGNKVAVLETLRMSWFHY